MSEMARLRNFKGQDGRYTSKGKGKSSRSGDDRHHGGSSLHDDHRDRDRDSRDLKPLLSVDPGPSSLLNVDPSAYRYRYSSSSRVNANNYYRHNRFRMLNGHPLGRLTSTDSTDSDVIVAGTSGCTSPTTELPSPTTEPSAPPLELASPSRSSQTSSVPSSPKVVIPNTDNIDLPPTYEDVMQGKHLRRQLPFAPKSHSNSTPDITSEGRRSMSKGVRSVSQNEQHISEEEDEETTPGNPGSRKKSKSKKTTGSKIKKGLENIAFFLIQILD